MPKKKTLDKFIELVRSSRGERPRDGLRMEFDILNEPSFAKGNVAQFRGVGGPMPGASVAGTIGGKYGVTEGEIEENLERLTSDYEDAVREHEMWEYFGKKKPYYIPSAIRGKSGKWMPPDTEPHVPHKPTYEDVREILERQRYLDRYKFEFGGEEL